ncbi:V-type ATP synthase subunit E [Desemzia sp. RIT804]|uniref:V-type ATP synthase subunit E n=1 Tax=Desemzia sp. RIT 804 TaxID=2810209 RepID=UPI00194F57DC|nr:V-type ATP synthase subunit E [Desemzia sp. RIT 804]MBM6613647.1 V-type ATP synthase subunit E [Desemzia sp. RIT 804]
MADLKLLTDRLMEHKRSEIQVIIQEAEKEAQQSIQASNEQLKVEKQKREERIKLEQKAQYEQDKNALSNKKRNQLLTEKQKSLTAIFDSAKERMENLTQDEFQQFLSGVLTQYQNKEVELVLGEKSRSFVSSKWVEELNQAGKTVHLTEEQIPKKAGFVIRHEGIDYNYIFDALVDDTKEDILPTVSQKLFQ